MLATAYHAPLLAYLLMIGAFVIAAVVTFLRRGRSATLTLVILAVVLAFSGFQVYRSGTIFVEDSGVRIGGTVIGWDDVQEAKAINDLTNSEYKPVNRTMGADLIIFKSGTFKLRNGETATVALADDNKAVVIRTHERLYLISPEDFDGFVAELKSRGSLI